MSASFVYDPHEASRAPARLDWNLVRIFVTALEEGSFSAAATRLSLPRSSISRSVAALEAALGVQLFRRTTRSVSATEEGAALYKRVSGSIAFVEASLTDLFASHEQPTGVVRVTTTAELAVSLLPAALSRYTARYPEVRVRLHVAREPSEEPGENFDLAVRVSQAPLPASSWVQERIGRIRLQLFASTAYLARRGTPRSHDDLRGHDWIAWRNNQPPIPSQSNHVSSRVECADPFVARELVRQGAGIAILPLDLVESDVEHGVLVRLLPQWAEFVGTIYLVSAPPERMPREVSLLRDEILELARRGRGTNYER